MREKEDQGEEPATADRDSDKTDAPEPRSLGGRLGRAATSSQGAAYEGAMEAVFSILIAVGLGYWADSAFESAPIGLIAGAIIGFAAFVLRLLRMRELLEDSGSDPEHEVGPQPTVAARPEDREPILRAADRRASGGEDRATVTESDDPTER